MSDELIEYDAIGLNGLLKKGEVTPVELLEITIQRIEKINPKLNAVIHKMYNRAREAAKTWSSDLRIGKARATLFSGVPFL